MKSEAVNQNLTRAHKVFHDCAETTCKGENCLYFGDDAADWRHGCEMGIRSLEGQLAKVRKAAEQLREALRETQ